MAASSRPSDEITALGKLAGDTSDRLMTTPAQGVHAAIADRVFGGLGALGLPARALHDGIATATYAGVRVGVTQGARLAAGVAKARGNDPDGISRSPRGARAIAAANALVGHELAADDDPLAIHMGLWHEDRPLAPADVGDVLPRISGKLVVFVHGLGETEHAWRIGTDEDPEGGLDHRGRPARRRRPGYGELLDERSGWTPLFVRANTGLPIAENGQRLSWLLAELLEAWPTDVEQIALVGHSMGGMICRAAGQLAVHDDSAWRRRLTHVACLGTPHQGAPLEQGVHRLAGLLARVPEVAPFGRILDMRSAGIRDLRRGIDAGPLLDDVHHLFVGATITADPKHPLGLVLGDLLVRSASAAGPPDVELEVDDAPLLGGLTHFHLLNHPRVFEHLEVFLTRDRAPRRQLTV